MPGEYWTQADERIKPVPLGKFPWKPLPLPKDATAKVTVSLIQTSKIDGPLITSTPDADEGDRLTVPAFSCLIEHGEDAILWDLGLRADPENFTPYARDVLCKIFKPTALREGPIAQLRASGFDLNRLRLLALSHKHFDHHGDLDTLPSTNIPILVGPGTIASVSPGYPKDQNQEWPSSWLEKYNFVELPDPSAGEDQVFTGELAQLMGPGEHTYQPVGPFKHGVDWFGDGSLWFVDAPGHCEGHIMAICRVTTSPPTYILLAGDAAHHQDVYTPVPASPEDDLRLPKPVVDGVVQMAVDPEVATWTIGQLTRMSAEPDVMVLLAHELPAVGLLPEYPHGTLEEWKEKGWKEAKERETAERARKRVNGRTVEAARST